MTSSDDDSEANTEALFGCIALMAMIPIGIFMQGFVLSQLWGWFVVPLGVVQIGMAHALGLSFVVSLFTLKLPRKDAKGQGGEGAYFLALRFFAGAIVAPLFLWGAGWLCYCWI